MAEKQSFDLSRFFFRLSTKEKMLFARHMEIMITSGMQILDSLEILKRQTKSKTFRKILDQLMFDVKNGHFLSAGLVRYQNIFGDFFVNLVRVGETSGTLAENFKYIAEELRKRQELNNKIRDAMLYPLIILLATSGITGLLTFFVFPKVLPIFRSLRVELPLVTRFFIGFSEFMIHHGLWVGVGCIFFAIGIWLLLKIRRIRFVWHRTLLLLPAISTMSQAVNMVNFARTLALLLRSGMQIVESLTIAANTLSNLVYQEEIKKIAEAIGRGETISKSLLAHPTLFPPIFSQMILIGENTGKLDETASYLAGFYESELDEATKALSSILEPLLLIVMGIVVSVVALSIILPIYKITQTIGR